MTKFYALVRKHDGDLKGEPLNSASVITIGENLYRRAVNESLELWEVVDHVFTKCLYAPTYDKEWAHGSSRDKRLADC